MFHPPRNYVMQWKSDASEFLQENFPYGDIYHRLFIIVFQRIVNQVATGVLVAFVMT
jgi:hypothetical protein